jgi:hypothetical protein
LVTQTDEKDYKAVLKTLEDQLTDIKGITVSDDIASMHSQLVKGAKTAFDKFTKNVQIAAFL